MFSKDDIITTDKYKNAFPNIYFKTDVFYENKKIFWRDDWLSPPIKNLPVILSGHSDYCINDEILDRFAPNRWFTVNKQTIDENVIALPLGITNNTNESEIHPIYGDLDSMVQVMNENIKIKNLVYMNFNISTFRQERQYVYDLFKDKKWVTKGNAENTIEGRTNFLRDIKAHTFVLCPRGNGIDTHRLWETLYMGSIPIIIKNIANEGFQDLPICFINDWSEITIDFLEQERERIKNTTFCLDKLKISYWIKEINKAIEETDFN
jgi:hypothetical protein